MKNIVLFLLMIFTTLVLFISCDDSSTDPQNGSGQVSIKLTDAPFPIEFVSEANITIDKVTFISGSDTVAQQEFDIEAKTYNLLDLRNGVTADLSTIEVLVGTYNQIRLHVVDAEIILVDSTKFDLTIPSGDTSGLKINIKPHLVIDAESSNEILLDFDVSKSFIVQGSWSNVLDIGGFKFKPVIRATNTQETSTVMGVVYDDSSNVLHNAEVNISGDNEVDITTYCDSLGHYKFLGIPAGTYSLTASMEGYVNSTNPDVTVGENTSVTVDFNLSK